MFFHVILTSDCNLQCKYCFDEAILDTTSDFIDLKVDYNVPSKIKYSIDLLKKFCNQDSDCNLIFYGGEPLLCLDEIRKIMDYIKVKNFFIQTNGLLLDQLEPKYLNRFQTIFVSIDGNERLTDYYRGKGTYRKVINNLKYIKSNGYCGELVARMTVMEQTDIYQQVKHLLGNQDFSFSSVHWQLNAGFWGSDFSRRDFKNWSIGQYNKGIDRLVSFWIKNMNEKGKVLRILPFMGITKSLLLGERSSYLRCGSGWINYSIQTNGKIIPCPVMWGLEDYYLGSISTSNPLKLDKVIIKEPCEKCDVLDLCGGRCLYANVTKRWDSDSYELVCRTVKNLITTIKNNIPLIKQLIKQDKINLKAFDFIKYNGCEVIP
jgi:putative peptide-modifying radical SAM enzyme